MATAIQRTCRATSGLADSRSGAQPAPSLPAPTRPRLQALNHTRADVDEQLRQATHIIGLPDDWDTLTGEARASVARRVVCARADWVVRWILDKLKDAAEGGAQARASVKAWKLLDWMVDILPVSRCAPHLRDAGFLSILETVLQERYSADAVLQPEPMHQGSHPRDDSSETVQEDPQPSRKRKRGSGASTPSKRATVQPAGFVALFDAVAATVRSIRDKGDAQGRSDETIQSEHMKMVLRTESAQAARILKHWLNAVLRLHSSGQRTSGLSHHLDLSLVVEIWDLRAIDTKDHSGASVDPFSTECLIPSLLLSQTLLQQVADGSIRTDSRNTLSVLDRLIAKHILTPSRTAFFNASSEKDMPPQQGSAELLSSSLEPLSAKLLQAAQIQDSGVEMSAYFAPLFAAVPHLLHLVIRSSPARSPKARTAEKPWIQVLLATLAQCVGCSLAPPEFAAPRSSIAALEACLTILSSNNVNIDTQILRDFFWFHSGLKYPVNRIKVVNWSLMAALVEIDSSIFLADPKTAISSLDERPDDLAAFLFEHISAAKFENRDMHDDDRMDVDDGDQTGVASTVRTTTGTFSGEDAVKKIIVPVVHAFSRNRQLLGFLELWDNELRRTVPISQDPLAELQPRLWEHQHLILALAEIFEHSLTLTQITTLFQKHAERLGQYTKKHPKKALSSAVIIQAMLQSIKSDEIIEALRPTILTVWKVYEAWVQHDGPSQSTALKMAWISLCFLLRHLWPIRLHESAALQKKFIEPLLDRAVKDVNSARKGEPNQHTPSSCRMAAAAFIFVACDHLHTMPDTAEIIQKRLEKTLKAMTHGQMDPQDLGTIIELFCIEYAQILAAFDADTAQKVLSRLLEIVSGFDVQMGGPLVETLSASIFNHGNAIVEAAFVSVLLDTLDQADDNLRPTSLRATSLRATSLRATSLGALLHISPSSLSREQREAALDKLLGLLTTAPNAAVQILDIMVLLMQVPNATARISTDGNAFFDIAHALHKGDLELLPVTQLLRELVRLTLRHLLPNKDQVQNKVFFTQYGDEVTSSLKKSKTCSPARLAVLTGTLLATHGSGFLLPPMQYLDFLSKAVNRWTSSQEFVLDAYNQVPLSVLRQNEAHFKAAQENLRQWINDQYSIENLLKAPSAVSDEEVSLDMSPTVLVTIAKFDLYQLSRGTSWLFELASRLLQKDSMQEDNKHVLKCLSETLAPLKVSEKLLCAYGCISLTDKEVPPQIAYRLLHVVVSAMDDKEEVEPDLKAQQMALLPKICALLGTAQDNAAFNMLFDNINTILLHKSNMTSQHNIECVLTALLKLATRSSPRLSPAHAPAIYARLCETARLVLLLHRGRLGGRFHLLLPLLQSLLLCLFIPNLNRGAALPPWLDSPSPANPARLTATNAAQYAHLLSTLCSPTQSSVQRTRSATTLNDPIKAAREYASHYVYPLLSSFCRFQLYGRLDAEVREKLMPGMWEVVGVGHLNKDAIDAMFAGLGKSEKDVWRGVWGEWVRVHGRKERKVKDER
jgi:nucleolar pre-ribosomal-associated protein 2